jgi:hypothetical protein
MARILRFPPARISFFLYNENKARAKAAGTTCESPSSEVCLREEMESEQITGKWNGS